jgi:2',3'-cyclic-nucleotide 2'-phosphodiesterase/3'-nucleotidase
VQVNPAFSDPKPQHYNYDMWEGLEYKLNISCPEGQRVVELLATYIMEKGTIKASLNSNWEVVWDETEQR